MKKTISYIILLALCVCCGKDSENPNIEFTQTLPILFSCQINNIILGKSIISENTFPANSPIGVFAWGHKLNEIELSAVRKDLNNKTYTKSSNSNEFTTDSHAHYPINPDTLVNFYAYYPYTDAATATPLSIPFNLKNQDDIMWATPVTDRDKTTADQKVNLSFNHILSAVTLKFKKADDIKEDMILQSISMENYSSTIQLNVQTGILSANASISPFTIDSKSEAITSTETTIVTDYLLYPVDKPVFIVKISGKDYRIESKKGFEKGKKQTYTFTIQASDISLSGSINPWVDGGTSDETIYF